MRSQPEILEEFIWELRRAFRDLTDTADQQLRTLGIQAADRAFVEFLAREQKPVSLSQLARKYSVSRQHIQQTLRRLPHPEWIEEGSNPTDRRTVILRLSRQGQAAWKQIRKADGAFLTGLSRRFTEEQVLAGTDLLKQLRRELKISKGGPQ
jgi:DNA-binding MarR family transcriptional regulator